MASAAREESEPDDASRGARYKYRPLPPPSSLHRRPDPNAEARLVQQLRMDLHEHAEARRRAIDAARPRRRAAQLEHQRDQLQTQVDALQSLVASLQSLVASLRAQVSAAERESAATNELQEAFARDNVALRARLAELDVAARHNPT